MEFAALSQTIEVNIADREALMRAVEDRFRAGRGFSLATINLDHLVKLRRDAAFAEAYAAQDFVVADGNPIVWMSRLAQRPVTLLPGSDLVEPLARLAAECGVKLGLVGSTTEALEGAAEVLRARCPGLEITACIAPPMGFDPTSPAADEIFSELKTAGVGFVFLALGAPKQEIMAARGAEMAPGIGFASIGAGLDFLTGSQVRAPRIVRALAMEWLWRMLKSPRRLVGRYAQCIAILPGQMLAAWRLRSRASDGSQ